MEFNEQRIEIPQLIFSITFVLFFALVDIDCFQSGVQYSLPWVQFPGSNIGYPGSNSLGLTPWVETMEGKKEKDQTDEESTQPELGSLFQKS